MAYLNGAFRADVWDATISMGGVELLEPALAVRLSLFDSQVGQLRSEGERWNRLSEELLQPYASAGPERFYDAAGLLRPEYGWYTSSIIRISAIMSNLAQDGRELISELRTIAALDDDEGASPSPDAGA